MSTDTKEEKQLELEKWEEWYALTKEELENTEVRFDKIEAKMSRYSVLITFIIGIVAIKLFSFIEFWKSADSCLDYYFVVSFISLGISAYIALFLYILSLEFETFYRTPVNPDSLIFFKENDYINAIWAMSESNMKAINKNKAIIEKKLFIAHMAYRFTLATIILTAFTVFMYAYTNVT
ncbi:MAG: hypothetical protein HOG89_01730 [Candidatus Peribacter sp.]|jgi:hypothetical protein|nr:hypothetical protein [Candidatus Peribacter sp.]MBT4392839.1 hypothetical protein [Candidatus Peribacter sp.]MBT4601470.1 hypothetical protein [Candidatus Peribacter sp.]MBT5148787.1 hypothetical protein [Candidatus Peribacter sp.]MBT5637617.1 hypothetical protein [Candidatus Peribacter sp.]